MIKRKKLVSLQDYRGFTLIELMIALAVGSIIVGAIYASYIVQQRSYTTQEAVAETQQNIRAAMSILGSDIRMAGYHPSGGTFGFINGSFNNGVVPALPTAVIFDATNIAFTADLDGDGSIDKACEDVDGNGRKDMSEMEQIAYRLNNNNLQRYSTTTGPIRWHTIAENIENIDFQYLDNLGNPTAIAADIRSVQVSILARASRPDRRFTNTMVYCPASNPFVSGTGTCTNGAGTGWGPHNDNFRRRLLITRFQCRNMGL